VKGEAVHYWLTIWAVNNPKNQVYVDDGFSGGFVHNVYPLPRGYKYAGRGQKTDFGVPFVPIPGYMPEEPPPAPPRSRAPEPGLQSPGFPDPLGFPWIH
jgi:hypothetical protein